MRFAQICSAAALFAGLASPALAGTNLVTDGDFETTTNGIGQLAVTSSGQQVTGVGSPVTGITSLGTTANPAWYVNYNSGNTRTLNGTTYNYPFLFVGNSSADTTGFPDPWDSGTRYVAGPADGGAAGNNFGASPNGGNFLIMDGGYNTQAINQNIAGLVVGDHYMLTFYFAGAMWDTSNTGGSGTASTTDKLQVTFGNQTQYTDTQSVGPNAFGGWELEEMFFTYTGTNNILSFFDVATGSPPLALLDGVSLTDIPEPTTWGALLLGVAGTLAARRRRRRA